MNLNTGQLPTYKSLFPVLRTQTTCVEMVVDKHVDNNCKCVIITILHHIAQGLYNLNN